MNYTLNVWSINTDGNKTLQWTAPFKSEADLLKSVIEYSRSGYYCQVEYTVKG